MPYSLTYKASVKKDLRKIQPSDLRQIIAKIATLANNPFPTGSSKLRGSALWRIRSGDFRIIYEVKNDELIITVVKVGHRREVYRTK